MIFTSTGEIQETLLSEKTDGNVEDTPKDEKSIEQPPSEVQQPPPEEGEDDGSKGVLNEDSNESSTQVKEDLQQEATVDNPEGESKPEIVDEETVAKKEEDEPSQKGEVEVPEGQAEEQEEGNGGGEGGAEGLPEDGQVSEDVKESTDGEKKPEEAVKSEEAKGDEDSNSAAEEATAADEGTAPVDESVAEEVKNEEGKPNDEATS